MVLDNMLVEFLQLAAIDGRKIPALLALQEEVDVFRGVGKKAVANAGGAFDAGAGDDALFFKALKVAIHRGGSHFGALVSQGIYDVLAREEGTLMRLDAGKDKFLLLGAVLLGVACACHALSFVSVRGCAPQEGWCIK